VTHIVGWGWGPRKREKRREKEKRREGKGKIDRVGSWVETRSVGVAGIGE